MKIDPQGPSNPRFEPATFQLQIQRLLYQLNKLWGSQHRNEIVSRFIMISNTIHCCDVVIGKLRVYLCGFYSHSHSDPWKFPLNFTLCACAVSFL